MRAIDNIFLRAVTDALVFESNSPDGVVTAPFIRANRQGCARKHKIKAAPKIVGTFPVVCYSPIDKRHRFTSKTRQIVQGQLMGAMAGLAICQPPGSQEFYLFGCDANWEVVTDTWHQSLDEAKEQAEFEYEGIGKTWLIPKT